MAGSVSGPGGQAPQHVSVSAAENAAKAGVREAAKQEGAEDRMQATMLTHSQPIPRKTTSQRKVKKPEGPDKDEKKTKRGEKKKKKGKLNSIPRVKKFFQNPKRDHRHLRTRILIMARVLMMEMADRHRTEVQAELEKIFPDIANQDEALELLEVTLKDFPPDSPEAKTLEKLKQVRDDINDRFGPDIRAGRNMGQEARDFSAANPEMGLKPMGLKGLYWDLIGDPRKAPALYTELREKFGDYEDLQKVIQFLFNSMGRDLTAERTSIDRQKLAQINKEIQKLQAFQNIFRHFKGRIDLLTKLFEQLNISPGEAGG